MLLDIINSHVAETESLSQCTVYTWLKGLSDEEQEAFAKLRKDNRLVVARLYNTLKEEVELPFRLTAFRSHMKGYCTCQK